MKKIFWLILISVDLYGYPRVIVPILSYHDISNRKGIYTVSPKKFREEMYTLRRMGYKTISLEKLADIYINKETIPYKRVVLTFDDGYKSMITVVAPLLKRLRYTATFFVYTDFIKNRDNRYALSWNDLIRLSRMGFSIGSHTVKHKDLSKGLSKIDIYKEMIRSKLIIEKEIGIPIKLFAFPYGVYSKLSKRVGSLVGYTIFVSSFSDEVKIFKDYIILGRRTVKRKTTIKEFKKLLKYRIIKGR